MSFALPPDLVAYLGQLDSFIETKIKPLQAREDNERFFDHRREHARTDWDNQGLPRDDWEDLLGEARKLADEAGFYRFCLPEEYGGKNGGNLWMAVIRMHLAKKGLGLFNDLQNEHSVVGNFPDVLMVREFGTEGKLDLLFFNSRREVSVLNIHRAKEEVHRRSTRRQNRFRLWSHRAKSRKRCNAHVHPRYQDH